MLALDEKIEKIAEIITMIKDTVGPKDVFLEITAQDEKLLPEIKKINTQILHLAELTTTECIVDNNYFIRFFGLFEKRLQASANVFFLVAGRYNNRNFHIR